MHTTLRTSTVLREQHFRNSKRTAETMQLYPCRREGIGAGEEHGGRGGKGWRKHDGVLQDLFAGSAPAAGGLPVWGRSRAGAHPNSSINACGVYGHGSQARERKCCVVPPLGRGEGKGRDPTDVCGSPSKSQTNDIFVIPR